MSLNITRLLLISLLTLAGLGGAQAAGGVSLYCFRQDCHELSTRSEGQNAATARTIIRSWIQGVNTRTAFNPGNNDKSEPLGAIFKDAEDPVWCAASIKKFLAENRDFLPDDLSAVEALPLWWMSVHPDAEPRHKEMLRARLMALKGRKAASAPVRRFVR